MKPKQNILTKITFFIIRAAPLILCFIIALVFHICIYQYLIEADNLFLKKDIDSIDYFLKIFDLTMIDLLQFALFLTIGVRKSLSLKKKFKTFNRVKGRERK